mgnify:CR=1 FL=1
MAQELIYPGSSSFFPGQTPFGIYDDDYVFQDDAPKMALWCARRLGFPIQNVELQDENFYACFEESVSEYSAQVNQFNIRNDLYSLKGRDTGTIYSGKLVEGSILPHLVHTFDLYSQYEFHCLRRCPVAKQVVLGSFQLAYTAPCMSCSVSCSIQMRNLQRRRDCSTKHLSAARTLDAGEQF